MALGCAPLRILEQMQFHLAHHILQDREPRLLMYTLLHILTKKMLERFLATLLNQIHYRYSLFHH